jgi:hypothetical protein
MINIQSISELFTVFCRHVVGVSASPGRDSDDTSAAVVTFVS